MYENDLIYLLEDEPDVASVFCRALEEAGVIVQHYRRLQEFRLALQRRRPTLCIIDLGPVDKVDSQISGSMIQDCLLGGGFGSRRPDGYGMADH